MKSILIIDDDEIVCRVIEKLALHKDVLVTAVNNGKDAKNILQSGKKFDVVFLDLVIPDITGWDILNVIKNDPVMKDTPVVILTGLTLSNEEIEKLHVRVTAIIAKNTFNNAKFGEILNKLLAA